MDWNNEAKTKRILNIWEFDQIRVWTKWQSCIPTWWHRQPATPTLNGMRISSLFHFPPKKRMYCDCYHSRECSINGHHWHWKQCDRHGSHGFALHNRSCSLLLGYFFSEASQVKQSRFDICLHVDILFCRVSPTAEEGNVSSEHRPCAVDHRRLWCRARPMFHLIQTVRHALA